MRARRPPYSGEVPVAWSNFFQALGKSMKLIANWRKAYKMLSIQAMAFATAIQGAWMFLPDDMKTTLPPSVVQWVTMGLLAFGIVGRLVDQPKVKP
tara:strand:- start:3908 stop:4195 length:288 start_codon:yes stop_codon:yes gene_type:complete